MDREIREQHVINLMRQMAEYVDVVLVSVSYQDEEDVTHTMHAGTGNWNARVGMAHHFLKEDENVDMARAFAQETSNDEDFD